MMTSAAVGLMVSSVYMSLRVTDGHGQMMDPPARPVLAKVYPGQGFPFDNSYNHHNCGGRQKQYSAACNGTCGVCGDPCDASHPQQVAGGLFATGFITRRYTSGQVVDIHVHVSMSHGGYMEFRLCPNNNIHRPVTHACLNQHVLQLADGSGTRYPLVTGNSGMKVVPVRLPRGLVCSQCVLQWKMHGANDWGVDAEHPHGCTGCGTRQEEFYGCADIAISDPSGQVTLPSQPPRVTVTSSPSTTPSPSTSPLSTLTCHGLGLWTGNDYMDKWCTDHCIAGNCPSDYCACS